MQTWLEVDCAHCGQANLIDNGDPFDSSDHDADRFRCWKCKACNSLDDEGDAKATEETEEVDDGRVPPDVADGLQGEVKQLRWALGLACTPPYKQGGIPGRRDEGLEGFFLRRAAEAAKEKGE